MITACQTGFGAGTGEVWSFWTAYVLTRPLDASFADWVGVGPERGGVGIGTGVISLVLIIIIAYGVIALVRFSATEPA